jgi:hypothetical protein
MGEEYLGVYEMRYRQLINDVGEGGIFGHSYYSQDKVRESGTAVLLWVYTTDYIHYIQTIYTLAGTHLYTY